MNNCETCVKIDVCRIRNSIFRGITTLKEDDVDMTCRHYRENAMCAMKEAVIEEAPKAAPKRRAVRKAKK